MTEFRPGRFQILPTVIKNLIIINVLVYMAQEFVFKATTGHSDFENLFALHTWQSEFFQPWQFITYMFLHGSPDHIFSNMLALWFFGSVLENLWGPKRFLVFYIACGLGAALCHMIVLYYENNAMIAAYNALLSPSGTENAVRDFIYKYAPDGANLSGLPVSKMVAQLIVETNLNTPTLGASGSVFGCLAAFGFLFPNSYIYIYFLFPIKAKWFVMGYAALEFFSAIQNSAGDNVAHIAHLGGALIGIVLVYYWNKNNRRNFY